MIDPRFHSLRNQACNRKWQRGGRGRGRPNAETRISGRSSCLGCSVGLRKGGRWSSNRVGGRELRGAPIPISAGSIATAPTTRRTTTARARAPTAAATTTTTTAPTISTATSPTTTAIPTATVNDTWGGASTGTGGRRIGGVPGVLIPVEAASSGVVRAAAVLASLRAVEDEILTRRAASNPMEGVGRAEGVASRGGTRRRRVRGSSMGRRGRLLTLSSEEVIIHLPASDCIGVANPEESTLEIVVRAQNIDAVDGEISVHRGLILQNGGAQLLIAAEEGCEALKLLRAKREQITMKAREQRERPSGELGSEPVPEREGGGELLTLRSEAQGTRERQLEVGTGEKLQGHPVSHESSRDRGSSGWAGLSGEELGGGGGVSTCTIATLLRGPTLRSRVSGGARRGRRRIRRRGGSRRGSGGGIWPGAGDSVPSREGTKGRTLQQGPNAH